MAILVEKDNGELGAEEKLIAFNILFVIYMHDKRYAEALEDIGELLDDSEMQKFREYLRLKQSEATYDRERFLNKKKTRFFERVYGILVDLSLLL